MTTIEEGRAAAASVTGSDLAVLLVDLPSQEIVAVSDKLLEMLESDRGQIIGCPITTFVAGNHPRVLSLLASGHLDGAEADRMVKGLDGVTFPVHAWAHVLGRERPARYAGLAAASGSGLGALVRVRLLRADGSWQPSRMRLAPLVSPPGFRFILRSITGADPTEAEVSEIDRVLRRLSEYLLAEQALLASASETATV